MRTFVVCLALLVACTFTASAQVAFGIQGNVVNFKVSQDLKDLANIPAGSQQTQALEQVYGMGYGGGIHLDFSLGILSFRVTGDYMQMTPDNAKFQDLVVKIAPSFIKSVTVSGGKITVIGGAADLKLVILPIPVVKPYITGGIGISQVNVDDAKLTITPIFGNSFTSTMTLLKKQTPMTLNGGVGVDLSLGISLYAEVKVTAFFLEGGTSTYLPIATVGLTF
jgi:hypothetical protein